VDDARYGPAGLVCLIVMPLSSSAGPLDARFLLVEDEMMVSLMLGDMLADLGCTVVAPVPSVDQGSRYSKQKPSMRRCSTSI
jgi:hypothetical protein